MQVAACLEIRGRGVSRLTDLIAQAKAKDPSLGAELEKEIRTLANRRSFGLNFERHRPESVELPGRPIRKGDKVRILPPRSQAKKGDKRLWKVLAIRREEGHRVADVATIYEALAEQATVSTDDLVVVAEFKDYIYPGLTSTGRVTRGGGKPFHTVINGENFHALEALTFTHRGKIDAIYIDPPYNSGAKDWKYNNDYVEKEDLYRHSKWLAMLECRLNVSKHLLNPEGSVLIVTIDEKEVHRLGLLLEQIFPEARSQMISSAINPKGSARGKEFYRVDEYIFFLAFGKAVVQDFLVPGLCVSKAETLEAAGEVAEESAELDFGQTIEVTKEAIRWASLLRSGSGAQREESHLKFYPIFIDVKSRRIIGCGEPLPLGSHPEQSKSGDDIISVWPTRSDGSEGRWQLNIESFRSLLENSYVKIGTIGRDPRKTTFYYLMEGQRKKLKSGEMVVSGYDDFGGAIVEYSENAEIAGRPRTQRFQRYRSHLCL